MNIERRLKKLENRVGGNKPNVRLNLGGVIWEGSMMDLIDGLSPTLGPPCKRVQLSGSNSKYPILVHVYRGEDLEQAKCRAYQEHDLDRLVESDFLVWETLN